MRFIAIETERSGNVIINPDNITSISRSSNDSVMLSLGGYEVVYTKFTDIEAAVDYIQRAPSVSMGTWNGRKEPTLKGKHIPGGV